MATDKTEGPFERLKERLRSGDPAERERGLNDLLAHYRPRVQRYATRAFFDQLRPALSAQDVTQQVCLKLARRLREGRIELRTERQFLALLRLMTERTLADLKGGPAGRARGGAAGYPQSGSARSGASP